MDDSGRHGSGNGADDDLWAELEDQAATLSEDARMVLVRMSIVPEKIQHLFKCLCLLLGVGPGMPSRKGSRLTRHGSGSNSDDHADDGSPSYSPTQTKNSSSSSSATQTTAAPTPSTRESAAESGNGDPGSGEQDYDSQNEDEETDGIGFSEDYIACARSLLKKPFFTSILLENRTAFCTQQALGTALAHLKLLDRTSMYTLSHAAGVIHTWCTAVTTTPRLPPHSP